MLLTGCRIDFSKNIRVLVGSDKQEYLVHKNLITRRSPFFASACGERWNDLGKFNAIELPKDDVQAFSIFLECVYRDQVVTEEIEGEQEKFEVLVRTYCLADKLGDLTSANLVIDEILRYSDKELVVPEGDSLSYAFNNSPEDSPLCRLIVDYYMHEAGKQSVDRSSGITQDFLLAFFKRFQEVKSDNISKTVGEAFRQTLSAQGRCYYHQHNTEHPGCDLE